MSASIALLRVTGFRQEAEFFRDCSGYLSVPRRLFLAALHQLRPHGQLEEGGVPLPEKQGNYTIPSHHGALRPTKKQGEDPISERKRKL